jgi:hypothetical protein
MYEVKLNYESNTFYFSFFQNVNRANTINTTPDLHLLLFILSRFC